MKLYSGLLSLFSRKVEIALNEKGLSFERIMVPFNQTVGYSPKHPEVLAVNPKGQIPILIDADLKLYDSTLTSNILRMPIPSRRSIRDRQGIALAVESSISSPMR